mgnify:FL=1
MSGQSCRRGMTTPGMQACTVCAVLFAFSCFTSRAGVPETSDPVTLPGLDGDNAEPAAISPVFDVHIHYSEDVWDLISPARAMALLTEAGISQAIVSSTPGEGAERLYRQAPERVVPFLRPYRTRANRYDWFRDPEILSWVHARLERVPYRGIGEFHVFGDDAGSPVVQEVIEIARQRGMTLMAHTDLAGIALILAQAADTDVIWAHAGFDVPLADLQSLLDTHPRLYLELSFREGMMSGGRLTPAWHDFLVNNSGRCLVGSDTYMPQRWADLPGLLDETRLWLSQLPVDAATRIASGNAERLFGTAGQRSGMQ